MQRVLVDRRQDPLDRRVAAERTAGLVDVRLELSAELSHVARHRVHREVAERAQRLAEDAVAQARRLWNVDLPTCTDVLSQLVESGFLCRKADGTYARATDLTARPLRMAKAGIQFVEIDRPARRAASKG